MTEQPRICPECGSDRWFAENFPLYRDKLQAMEDRLKRASAQHGVSRAEWELREIDLDQRQRTLHRKVRQQRRVINRLEAKLRDLRAQPYAPDACENGNGNGNSLMRALASSDGSVRA